MPARLGAPPWHPVRRDTAIAARKAVIEWILDKAGAAAGDIRVD